MHLHKNRGRNVQKLLDHKHKLVVLPRHFPLLDWLTLTVTSGDRPGAGPTTTDAADDDDDVKLFGLFKPWAQIDVLREQQRLIAFPYLGGWRRLIILT